MDSVYIATARQEHQHHSEHQHHHYHHHHHHNPKPEDMDSLRVATACQERATGWEGEGEYGGGPVFFKIIWLLLWTILIIVTWCNKAMIMSWYLAFSGHDAARTASHRHGRRKPWKFVFVFDVLIMKWKWFLYSSPKIWNIMRGYI